MKKFLIGGGVLAVALLVGFVSTTSLLNNNNGLEAQVQKMTETKVPGVSVGSHPTKKNPCEKELKAFGKKLEKYNEALKYEKSLTSREAGAFSFDQNGETSTVGEEAAKRTKDATAEAEKARLKAKACLIKNGITSLK